MDGLIPIYERHPPIGHTPIGSIRDVPIGYQSNWLGPLLKLKKGLHRPDSGGDNRRPRRRPDQGDDRAPGRLQDHQNHLHGPAAHCLQWPWEQRLTILTTTSRPDRPSSHTSSTRLFQRLGCLAEPGPVKPGNLCLLVFTSPKTPISSQGPYVFTHSAHPLRTQREVSIPSRSLLATPSHLTPAPITTPTALGRYNKFDHVCVRGNSGSVVCNTHKTWSLSVDIW